MKTTFGFNIQFYQTFKQFMDTHKKENNEKLSNITFSFIKWKLLILKTFVINENLYGKVVFTVLI